MQRARSLGHIVERKENEGGRVANKERKPKEEEENHIRKEISGIRLMKVVLPEGPVLIS